MSIAVDLKQAGIGLESGLFCGQAIGERLSTIVWPIFIDAICCSGRLKLYKLHKNIGPDVLGLTKGPPSLLL